MKAKYEKHMKISDLKATNLMIYWLIKNIISLKVLIKLKNFLRSFKKKIRT